MRFIACSADVIVQVDLTALQGSDAGFECGVDGCPSYDQCSQSSGPTEATAQRYRSEIARSQKRFTKAFKERRLPKHPATGTDGGKKPSRCRTSGSTSLR